MTRRAASLMTRWVLLVFALVSTRAWADEPKRKNAGISATRKRSLEAMRIPQSSVRQDHEMEIVDIGRAF